MTFFRRPSSGPGPLVRRDKSLPGWASSPDFRDFEEGADGDVRPAVYRTDLSEVDAALEAQTADGLRPSGGRAGVQQVGILQPFKPQIIKQAKGMGLSDEEAQYFFSQADKAAFGFVLRNGKPDTDVTPAEEATYRQEIEKAIPDPARRKRFLEIYEGAFRNGTLKRTK